MKCVNGHELTDQDIYRSPGGSVVYRFWDGWDNLVPLCRECYEQIAGDFPKIRVVLGNGKIWVESSVDLVVLQQDMNGLRAEIVHADPGAVEGEWERWEQNE